MKDSKYTQQVAGIMKQRLEDPPKVPYRSSVDFPISVMSCLLCGETECERGNHSVNQHWLWLLNAPLQWGVGVGTENEIFPLLQEYQNIKELLPPLIKVSSAT